MTTNLNEELKEVKTKVETLETEVHAAKTHFADLMKAEKGKDFEVAGKYFLGSVWMNQEEIMEEYWQGFVENNLKCRVDDLDEATNNRHTLTKLRIIGDMPSVGQSASVYSPM